MSDFNIPQGPVGGTENSDSLSEGFLKGIPENELPIVEKYVKDWDSGVTKKFQEIHETYAPYKTLGEIDELQKAVEVARFVNEKPEEAFRILKDILGIEDEDANQQTPSNPTTQQQLLQGQQGVPDLSEYLNPVNSRVDQMQQLLESLAKDYLGTKQAQDEAKAEAEFDDFMKTLHSDHGEFDDSYVMAYISGKIESLPDNASDAQIAALGAEAVKSFNDMLIKHGARPQSTPPPALYGNGSSPSSQQSIADLSRQDRVALVARMLEHGHK